MADISKIQIATGTYDIKDVTARNDIADLQIPRNFFQDRKFILIGDSYAAGEDGSGGYITSWEQLFIDYTGISSSNVIKKAQGGAGFCNLGSNKKFQTLLEEVTSADDITDIIVLGGYNDRSYNATQIQTAINEFRNSANTRFPNAKIHVGFVGWCKIAANMLTCSNAIRNYKQSCDYVGIHYFNGIEYSLHDYYQVFGNDGVHPNSVGQIYITFNLIQGLLAGSCQTMYPFKSLSITAKSGVAIVNNQMGCILKDNVVEVTQQSDDLKIIFSPTITINSARSTWIEIGDITDGYVFGTQYNFDMIPVRLITVSTEGYIESKGLVKFSNGKFYVNLGFNIDPSTGAYRTFTNLSEIKIDMFHATFLTDLC